MSPDPISKLAGLLDDLCRLAERHPRLEPRAPMLPDPDDEAFAQLAAAAAAAAVITHNLIHYEPAHSHGIRVMTPHQFFAKLRSNV